MNKLNDNLTVLKYGGSSVSSLDKIKKIANYLKYRLDQNGKLIIVVSAMGDTTDTLLANINQITKNPCDEHVASLLSTGEQQTVSYLAMALNDLGISAKPLTGYQAGILTTKDKMKSTIASIEGEKLSALLKENDILVVAGFQGINIDNEITTLGRGGSDTTATAIAATLNCPCEIYTDVSGIFVTDPRMYSDAKKLDMISYEEMMEMAFLGANVIETRSINIAMNYNIPLYIAKTLSKEKGTWIVSDENLLEKHIATGITLDEEVIQVNIKYGNYDPKLTKSIFSLLEKNNISIDMISQTESEEDNYYTFTAKLEDKRRLTKTILTLKKDYPEIEVSLKEDFVKVSVIGAGMMDTPGVISRIYQTVIENDIRIYQISTTGISISCLVKQSEGEKATRLLYEEFAVEK
ncbi:MAG: aspartate kinase [Atopostipes suicloacalis]|nr:aspartate kinase [Atopostipes suicloacalis]